MYTYMFSLQFSIIYYRFNHYYKLLFCFICFMLLTYSYLLYSLFIVKILCSLLCIAACGVMQFIHFFVSISNKVLKYVNI